MYERTKLDQHQYTERVRNGPCFICQVVAGTQAEPEAVIYRDDFAIAFLARYSSLLGRALVAPLEHREGIVADFDEASYLRLQSLVYRVGSAVSKVLPTERLYVLSLGSNQGNAHAHWHVAPLPPGVPYDRQQHRALMAEEAGYLVMPPGEPERLARRIGAAL
jgi:diadenosine tetraphosphate (Ap4A) HIT family hydrolase